MRKITSFLILLIAGFALHVSAQFGGNTIKIASGDLKFLKGVTDLKIEYNYDGMTIGDMQEDDYITKHTADLNKAKPGSGNEWKEKWPSDREKKFQPSFEKFFTKNLSKAKINASPSKTDAKYTMIIKTIKIEPGLYTGVSVVAKDTYIDVYAIFVETGKPDDELCKILASKFIGNAGDFASYDVSLRISAAYLNLGNKLSGFVAKTLKNIK
jgi:hypothetical protein